MMPKIRRYVRAFSREAGREQRDGAAGSSSGTAQTGSEAGGVNPGADLTGWGLIRHKVHGSEKEKEL